MIERALADTAPLWSTESTGALLAELARRQEEGERPACGSAQGGEYSTPAHVGALVLILVLSLAGCGFPLISQRANKQKGPNDLVFYSQHFGTGVLIATAFVHLLPTAFVSLTHPCLPWFFNHGYRPLAGVIAMIAALVVVGLEMFLRTRGVAHTHSHVEMWEPETSAIPEQSQANQDREYEESSVGLMGAGSWSGEPSPMPNGKKTPDDYGGEAGDSDLDLDELDPATGTTGHTGSRTNISSLSAEE
ncbi:hypothetical protein V492_01502, partial [Pseudogymnoascus sp. VKM F-4246]